LASIAGVALVCPSGFAIGFWEGIGEGTDLGTTDEDCLGSVAYF
jgi:hypothetical protein